MNDAIQQIIFVMAYREYKKDITSLYADLEFEPIDFATWLNGQIRAINDDWDSLQEKEGEAE